MKGDVDFDGNQLKNAAIAGGSIKDVTLSVSGQQPGGLAFYGDSGKLSGHPALAFKDGTLWASRLSGFEVSGSVDMRRNKLSNAAKSIVYVVCFPVKLYGSFHRIWDLKRLCHHL